MTLLDCLGRPQPLDLRSSLLSFVTPNAIATDNLLCTVHIKLVMRSPQSVPLLKCLEDFLLLGAAFETEEITYVDQECLVAILPSAHWRAIASSNVVLVAELKPLDEVRTPRLVK